MNEPAKPDTTLLLVIISFSFFSPEKLAGARLLNHSVAL